MHGFLKLSRVRKNKQISRSGFGSGLEWLNQDAMSHKHTNPEGFTKEQVQQCDVFCVRDNSTSLQSIKNSESCQFTKLFIHLLGGEGASKSLPHTFLYSPKASKSKMPTVKLQ